MIDLEGPSSDMVLTKLSKYLSGSTDLLNGNIRRRFVFGLF